MFHVQISFFSYGSPYVSWPPSILLPIFPCFFPMDPRARPVVQVRSPMAEVYTDWAQPAPRWPQAQGGPCNGHGTLFLIFPHGKITFLEICDVFYLLGWLSCKASFSDFLWPLRVRRRNQNCQMCRGQNLGKMPCFRAINPYPWNSSIQNDIKLLFSDRNKQSVCKSQVHYQHVEMFTQIVENHMLFVCSVHRLIVGTKSFFELAHPNKCGVFQSDSGTPSHHGFQH